MVGYKSRNRFTGTPGPAALKLNKRTPKNSTLMKARVESKDKWDKV